MFVLVMPTKRGLPGIIYNCSVTTAIPILTSTILSFRQEALPEKVASS